MTHLILCREYPPAPYPAGGIGTYARHIARQLAESGETVHMIAQRWEGAPDRIETLCDGRLIVHRISVEEPIAESAAEQEAQGVILQQLASSTCPSQLFSWQAARYVEALLANEHIDTIEAQEWEAPLYYLLARRAAGLGPAQQPPCIVHLHSPSQMIFEYNEWDQTLTDFLPLARFEEYTIRAADALLCPSRYLATQVSELFGVGPVEVIPYAMGVETPVLARSPQAWASDVICYVGRLELRKGVIEWVDAAVSVAKIHATVSFDFFGADTYLGGGAGPSVLEFLKKRIPAHLRNRFRFHGTRTRAELLQALSEVSIAVVPSRWENFPFTCIEAMSTGTPVLASPHGGMAEMINDGESGWITADGSPSGLEAGLRRALASTAAERQQMGLRAAETIRRICNNEAIVARHVEFQNRVAIAGTSRSLLIAGKADPVPRTETRRGMGIIVTCFDSPERLAGCLAAIDQQTQHPTVYVVASEKLKARIEIPAFVSNAIFTSAIQSEVVQQVTLKALLGAHPNLRSILMVDQNVRLESNFVEVCERIFQLHPAVGVITPWVLQTSKHPDLDPGPSPMSLDSLNGQPLPRYSALRVELAVTSEPHTWDLVRGGDWSAFTWPGPLVSVIARPGHRPKRRYSGMALIQSQSIQFAIRWFLSASLPEKARWLGRFARQPQRLTKWLEWQIRSRLRQSSGAPK